MRFVLISILLLQPFLCLNAGQVAIIIDDIGYRKTDQHALTLPGKISYAFLPHTPFAKELALQANQSKKDVLLHIPMEASSGKLLGPGAITSDMDDDHINHQLSLALDEIPFAVGINNHMGSHLTKLQKPMASTMKFLKRHKLFFVDSMTTSKSKTRALAHVYGVPHLHRHVFLDNHTDADYIEQQFEQLVEKAKHNEFAIGIAHPHPETIIALKQLLPTLTKHNIELVPVSSLFSDSETSQIKLASAE
ncbi:divergent polysaccharide deacetylase family protein [Thalassotalea sp. LPB0316]|uniref:divergent polysaccharide deacetylase family protein n=1 Tax=Thalassotalea sp. LPB0316 TaxID=2769490 RepID=UPI0018685221|nr:divergent polysaccharide deacetylase family protein [Thalassotalea sp. LPB0316]QOL26512.1 divergent polysaccharide deacetylase family protein [Thalassotalea sp. LPB0316]